MGGFHQLKLTPSASSKSAFATHMGLYEWTRLPFGFKSSPSIFQRLMEHIFRDHIGKHIFPYLDDLIIFSPTFEKHIDNLETTFKQVAKANLSLQPAKCAFAKSEIEYLGYKVTDKGISPQV